MFSLKGPYPFPFLKKIVRCARSDSATFYTPSPDLHFFLFCLKIHIKKTEIRVMPEEKQSRAELEKNVEHLRYRLTRYQIVGEFPPAKLLVELKMAELLLQLESTDTISVNIKT